MQGPKTLALDAMGGDYGPNVTVAGAALSLARNPDLRFILAGKEPEIASAIAAHPELAAKSRILHTDLAIGMDDKPSQALRRGKGSSKIGRASCRERV